MTDLTLVNMNMLYIKYLDGRVHRQCHLPLGPLYLRSVLREYGFNVDFRDYQTLETEEPFSPDALGDFLAEPAPIIGLSCMANLLPFVLHAVPLIKERYPDCKLVLGGVGPAAIEHQILERTPGIDVIHRGEGELSAPTLIGALRDGRALDSIANISYRRGGEIIHNPTAPRVRDLDSLPRPAYDDLDFDLYQGHNILGSRGCPFPCTFCSITPIWGWKTYSRSNQNIVDEMIFMHEQHGVQQFLFQDEYFVSGPERSIDFARRVRESGMDITYKVFARVDRVDEESMRAMAETGCVEIRFGVESGSDKILEKTQKGFDSRLAMQVVSQASHIFRSVDAFYVWGFPFETMQDFGASLFQMITLRGMGVRILPSLLTYLPQTRIFQELDQQDELEFCAHLMPEYMISGIENRKSVRISIDDKYADLFGFIMRNRDIFPGFFHCDIEHNINPKLALLEEFEFYNALEVREDSCGAHSPSRDEVRMTLNA